MRGKTNSPNRIHLVAHGNPAGKDIKRFHFADSGEYLDFVREHLPEEYRLTCSRKLLDTPEDQQRGGRRDDAARIRDVQNALDDPKTLAIVAAAGGAYFSRIMPHLDFSPLEKRRAPMWTTGFSEMTNFVNLVASYRGGRGLYWLCPNYLGWHVKPEKNAKAAFAEFWRTLPEVLSGRRPENPEHLEFGDIEGRLALGRAESGTIRLVGGCLTVLIAMLAGPLSKRLKPDGKWLVLEDLEEAPFRLDRYLATLKLAGWFDRLAGVVIGSFHRKGEDLQGAVLELLRFHLPKDRNVPVVTSNSFGHIWPMRPVEINRALKLVVRARRVRIS